MRFSKCLIAAALGAASLTAIAEPVHNVVLFIPDGLRAQIVSAETAPTFDRIRREGINFANPHSLFPTFTTPNASAMATGHFLGDTGDFGNTIYTGFQVPGAGDSVTPFLESDPVLGDVDEHFAGNYLDEETLLEAARCAGYSTAAIGKLGPIGIQNGRGRNGEKTIIVDDSTGRSGGIPLNKAITAAIQQAGLPLQAPTRGDNGVPGNYAKPGTLQANVEQQQYFVDVATKAVLPAFKEKDKPFVLVFWSRDPDGTQHNQGDSLGKLTPGINGPTTMAAIRNADNDLAQLMATLKQLGLDRDTDIFVTADHGFGTISKESKTSPSTMITYAGVPKGQLPPGFLAIDIANALGMPLLDPDAKGALVDVVKGQFPSKANGLIGEDANKPEVVVAANGGSDLVYLPQKDAKELAPEIVDALLKQDYVSGVFVDDSLGKIPGTLPLSSIGLKGSALTPYPAIAVNFRSFSTDCEQATNCGVEVADTLLQQGQGMHGSFGRQDTANFMAAIGPDFREGFTDRSPSSNADVGVTLAHVLKLHIPAKGHLVGRVLTETLKSGKPVTSRVRVLTSTPGANGLKTQLHQQFVGATPYFDVAGFDGRSVGLPIPSCNAQEKLLPCLQK